MILNEIVALVGVRVRRIRRGNPREKTKYVWCRYETGSACHDPDYGGIGKARTQVKNRQNIRSCSVHVQILGSSPMALFVCENIQVILKRFLDFWLCRLMQDRL
jgi:hypothetical protein